MKNPNMLGTPVRRPLANLNHSHVTGSPLRRSLLVTSIPVVKTKNDDEAERKQRRNNAEMQRRISSIGLNRSVTSDTELSDSKMQDHFQQCVRLHAENKINAKNAWNLQIIEYLRKILDSQQFESGDSLQMASTSLDIGSKVYGLRVDDIHNEIMKLASNMARINLETEQNADNDDAPDGDEDDEDAEAQKKKEKKRKKRISNGDENCQIVKEDSLTGKLTSSTTYNRTDSAKQRLYTLSALRTLKSGDEQLLASRSKLPYWSTVTAPPLNMRPLSGLVVANIPPANGTLCPSFADFVVDEWEPEDDLFSQSQRVEEVVYDEHGFPVPEMDRSGDNFDVDDEGDDIEEEVPGAAHAGMRPEVAHITDMRPGATSGKLEYSYREPPVISERYCLTGVWAGPSHWKVKCVQRTATATIVKQGRTIKKRIPKALPLPINFNLPDEQLDELLKPSKGRFMKTTFQQENRITYPEDLKITRQEIRSLFLKPDCYLQNDAEETEVVPRIEHDISNYVYDNPNDAEYCNDTLQGDALDAGDSDNEAAEPPEAEAEVENGSFMEDNMVNVPNLVQKSQVPYATQAKKVDMRRLKAAIIRTVMSQDPHNAEMLFDSDNDSEELLESCHFSKVSFCKMYEALPIRLNSRMAEEISCPLVFVALLHLCNERNLMLQGQEDLLDVQISKN